MTSILQDAIDPWRILLWQAARSHHTRMGCCQVFVGNNFVDCMVCRRHAHIHSATGQLVLHDAAYHSVEVIKPEDF